MTVSEKVAFLKGLMEGSGVDQESKYGKLFSMAAEILEDLAKEVAQLREVTSGLAEDADDMREGLGYVEDIVYGEEGPEPPCGRPCPPEGEASLPGGRIPVHGKRPPAPEGKPPFRGCPRCCESGDQEDWEDWDGEEGDDGEEGVFYEVTCPHCHETITVDEGVLELGTIQCPNCGEMMELGLEASDEEEAGETASPED